ncbi:MAG TPA: NADH-quinone oxidoreductase subunit M [Bacteroidia bacterium]|nr:NADH-quinone oxidoreductase subunit M [Bacteroidia bacterium]
MTLLPLLLFVLPVLGMITVSLISDRKTAAIAALLISVVSFADICWKMAGFDPSGGFQYVFDQWWVEQLGISFAIGIDGLGMIMLLLTNLLVPLIIFSSFDRQIKSHKAYYGLIFFMQAALNGVFTSMDGFLFYVFWELALIPIWFICLLWGGSDRVRITLKFFIYTLSGSLVMLVAIIWLYLQTPAPHDFSLQSFYDLSLTASQQSWVFWAFFLAFAIKIPVFPLHTWQPDTYTDAPSQGTMLLSGIMLKMGLYGILRWMIPVVPQAVQQWGMLAVFLAAIGIVYASAMAIAQTDFKRMAAYASMAHVGLIAAGLFTLNLQALQGGVFQMVSHGITAVGLFFIADILQDKLKSNEMNDMGGLANSSRSFSLLFMVILLGSVALPLTGSFVGEFLLLGGIFAFNSWLSLIAGLSVILGAVYMLRAYNKIALGENTVAEAAFGKLTANEKILLIVISVLIIGTGIYPMPLLKIAEPSIVNILHHAGVNPI